MYKDILNAWWTMYLPWSTMVQYSVLLNIPQLLVYFTNIQSEVYHWLTHTLSVSFQVVMSYHSDGCESTLLQLLQVYYNPIHVLITTFITLAFVPDLITSISTMKYYVSRLSWNSRVQSFWTLRKSTRNVFSTCIVMSLVCSYLIIFNYTIVCYSSQKGWSFTNKKMERVNSFR